MEYILFIHNNVDSTISDSDWDQFFAEARNSELFQGGSEIGGRILLGEKQIPDITQSIGGFMRFHSESVEALKEFLERHPVLISGGSLELCELVKS